MLQFPPLLSRFPLALAAALLLALPAQAQTFLTVDAYLTYLTGSNPIRSLAQASVGDSVFLAAQWDIEAKSGAGQLAFATVTVLKKLKDGSYHPTQGATPFDLSSNMRALFDDIEKPQAGSFTVKVFRYNPLGAIRYRFVRRGPQWQLVSRYVETQAAKTPDGSESDGELRTEIASNFLTGLVVEKRYRNHKLQSSVRKKMSFPEFPLADFRVLDDRHGEL